MFFRLRYVNENRAHQKEIDKLLKGRIVVIDRYINEKAIIRYGCVLCGSVFFQKPLYLLNPNNKHNHHCILSNCSNRKATKRRTPNPIPEEAKEMLDLYNQGHKISEIARTFGVSRGKTKYWIKKLRESS
ncbi:helix-turn-helix domain-containing protein [Neobacillus sp. K501]